MYAMFFALSIVQLALALMVGYGAAKLRSQSAAQNMVRNFKFSASRQGGVKLQSNAKYMSDEVARRQYEYQSQNGKRVKVPKGKTTVQKRVQLC